jgi:hypothetical protein
MSTPGPAARLASLFYEDAALTEGVQWLIDKHLRALEGENWASELGNAAIRILADGLLPDHYEVSEVDSDGIWVTSGGHRFPLREMRAELLGSLLLVTVSFSHRAFAAGGSCSQGLGGHSPASIRATSSGSGS